MKLIYYFDPLCGWCYGFSPVMAQIHKKYGDKIDIEVIPGGLFIGERTGPINQVASYIKEGAYLRVEQTTGVKFGQAFLDEVMGEGRIILDSLPATLALEIVKDQFPEKQVEFGSLLLKAIYHDGVNPIDIVGLSQYAEKVGCDRTDFMSKIRDEKYMNLIKQDYQKFSATQHSAMPALVAEIDGKEFPLSRGYVGFDVLDEKLQLLIQE